MNSYKVGCFIVDCPMRSWAGSSALLAERTKTAQRSVCPSSATRPGFYAVNRTGFIGGPIPREDGPDAPTQQVFPRVA